ncbi:hypothetical protein SUGI_0475030 [Cryptomeria japonica]|nr:hypothetical protein SUGI_0475030 [Cryptomeria japonica]
MGEMLSEMAVAEGAQMAAAEAYAQLVAAEVYILVEACKQAEEFWACKTEAVEICNSRENQALLHGGVVEEGGGDGDGGGGGGVMVEVAICNDKVTLVLQHVLVEVVICSDKLVEGSILAAA